MAGINPHMYQQRVLNFTDSLLSEQSRRMHAKKTYADKVRYFLEIWSMKQLLPRKSSMRTEKNEDHANDARQTGNQHYVARDYMAALEAYNEALCLAESESIGLAYANRAAIYLDTGFYRFCLENIQLALEHNYPEHLKPKLLHRKKICLEKMKTKKDSYEIYSNQSAAKLSYAADPKIPFMIDGLKFAENKKFGRHIVANRNLKPGDVLFVEEPLLKVVRLFAVYSHCYNCNSCNFYNLMPCPKSTKAMFCSAKCATEAWERYYKYECPIIDAVLEEVVPLGVLRTTLKAFTMVKDPATLKELIDSIDVETETPFTYDWNYVDELDKFRILYSMTTNESKMKKKTVTQGVAALAVVFHILMEYTDIKQLLGDSRENEDLLIEVLMHFMYVMSVNSIMIGRKFLRDSEKEFGADAQPGIGVFTLLSQLNHSCCPNVRRFRVGAADGMMVVRPIKEGEQLFISYGPVYGDNNFFPRFEFLRDRFLFDCTCEACKRCFPDVQPVPEETFLPAALWNIHCEILDENLPYDDTTIEKARKAKKVAADFLTKFHNENPIYPKEKLAFYPYSLVNGYLLRAMEILANKKPIDMILECKR